MAVIDVVLLAIGIAIGGFLGGVVFTVRYSRHLVVTGKCLPKYLGDIGVRMPEDK